MQAVTEADRMFAQVFEDHVGFVWRVLEHHGVRGSDTEDATQEVFLVVARRLSELQDLTRIRSWLYGIARRVAASHRRKAHVRRERVTDQLPTVAVDAGQHQQSEHAEALTRLDAVLAELREEHRMAFVLREIEQLTIQQVADAMGCPLQTAYSRVRVARERVLTAFQDDNAKEAPRAK